MKRVQDDPGFRIHLIVYLAVNVLLLVINLGLSPHQLWFFWPAFGWGLGIAGHALLVHQKQSRLKTLLSCRLRQTTHSDQEAEIVIHVSVSAFKRVSTNIIFVGIASFFVHVSSAEVQTAAMREVPSGQELFAKYCSQCHGTGGKGDGPLASSLKVAPADLTRIKQRAGGTFPASRIADIIRNGGNVEAHGQRDMPVWGKVFSDAGGHGKIGGAYSRRAVVELKGYLESIQQAP